MRGRFLTMGSARCEKRFAGASLAYEPVRMKRRLFCVFGLERYFLTAAAGALVEAFLELSLDVFAGAAGLAAQPAVMGSSLHPS